MLLWMVELTLLGLHNAGNPAPREASTGAKAIKGGMGAGVAAALGPGGGHRQSCESCCPRCLYEPHQAGASRLQSTPMLHVSCVSNDDPPSPRPAKAAYGLPLP